MDRSSRNYLQELRPVSEEVEDFVVSLYYGTTTVTSYM